MKGHDWGADDTETRRLLARYPGQANGGGASRDWFGGMSTRLGEGGGRSGIRLGGASDDAIAVSDEARQDVLSQLRRDVRGEELREASLGGAFLLTGGPARQPQRGGIGSGGFEMVRNGNWDAALNLAADPLGLLGEVPGLHADLAKLNRIQTEGRIEGMRRSMIDAGVKNVPGGYLESWSTGADGVTRNVRDYGATLNELQGVYEGHVRDQRLRGTWGDDYQNLRLGKSQMTVLDFEKRVLDIHQTATDRAFTQGVDAIASGKLQVEPGDYAKTLGNFIDKQVRDQLRGFARAEGIADNSMSNLWAIN